MLDVLIRGGWVIDGTGNPAYPADVGIQGDTIAEVGNLAGAEAARVIDASGKLVTPGFVDCHSHTDWSIQSNPTAESTIRQGVTTEIVGNCGVSNAPVSDLSRDSVTGRLRTYAYDGPVEWSTYREYLQFIEEMGTACNLAWFVGHNALRAAAGVLGPTPTEAQLQRMERDLAEALEAGVLGMTTGLEFEPGRTAQTPEIQRLARVVGRYGGYYASHIRNRDAHLQDAVDEFVSIVREGRTEGPIKGEISHLNVRHNTGAAEGAWGRAVATLERIREEGLDVLADCTPYEEGIGEMAAILPPWVVADGPEKASQLLREPGVRQRLRTECDRYWRFIHRGEWQRVRLQSSAEYPELIGKTFVEISEILGKDPWDCYFDILSAAGPNLDSVALVAVLFTDEHVAETVKHPLFSLAVDMFTTRIDGPLSEQGKHPIAFSGMIHYLTYHVRQKHRLRLEEAVRKMTSMPATHHGLRDRGLLRKSFKADAVVLDWERLADVTTIEKPKAYVRGVDQVLVNGVLAVDEGEHTGARPGRNLLRDQAS